MADQLWHFFLLPFYLFLLACPNTVRDPSLVRNTKTCLGSRLPQILKFQIRHMGGSLTVSASLSSVAIVTPPSRSCSADRRCWSSSAVSNSNCGEVWSSSSWDRGSWHWVSECEARRGTWRVRGRKPRRDAAEIKGFYENKMIFLSLFLY